LTPDAAMLPILLVAGAALFKAVNRLPRP